MNERKNERKKEKNLLTVRDDVEPSVRKEESLLPLPCVLKTE